MHCRDTIATPLNLGSGEMISINKLADIAEDILGVKIKREYNLDKPKGVAGRNSDNTYIKKLLGWEPTMTIFEGMKPTCQWIKKQYTDRKAGKRTAS